MKALVSATIVKYSDRHVGENVFHDVEFYNVDGVGKFSVDREAVSVVSESVGKQCTLVCSVEPDSKTTYLHRVRVVGVQK